MKRQVLVYIFFAVIGCGCRDSGVEPKQQPSPQGQLVMQKLSALENSVVQSDNSFGFKIFSHINKTETNKNVFISPFSISTALGMALNGADGATLDSMKQVLEHSNFTMQEINDSYKNISYILTRLDSKVIFQIANSIWCKDDFTVLPSFLDDCRSYFDAEVATLDFSSPSAVVTINNWVYSKTNGKISKLLDEIPSEVVMYLINAIYFKGAWTYQFDPAKTMDAPFITSMGNTVTCRMMTQKTTYAYHATSDAQIIDLPYGDRLFSMTIVLPKEGISIDQYSAALTQQQWDALVNSLDSTELELSMPKFKLGYEKKLNDELSTMGMGIAFTWLANFSRITENICIGEVKHITAVEVNEEGTEAAAVTSISIIRTSLPLMMRINRPFIFAIREHNSGTILFIGKIVNPVAL